eukprot:CAMPEP_0181448508 /NCGR_PEP_ID=MMETSP1110-20121109/27175_1 /TAXON_ID=174948 /ORGANISM="Symbiodinium sp., Strain CCMP421" /LENGTH=81 /DNA_ID=CAMNT_0023572657 /DNA_START=664 /DNA_END=909 /DNA_ORIENTATION=+
MKGICICCVSMRGLKEGAGRMRSCLRAKACKGVSTFALPHCGQDAFDPKTIRVWFTQPVFGHCQSGNLSMFAQASVRATPH